MKKKPSEKIISILNKHFDKLNKIAIGEVSKKQLIDDIKNDLDYDKNKLSDIYLLNLAIQPYAMGLRVDLNKRAFEILVSGLDIPPHYKIPKNNTFMTDAAKCGYYDKIEVLIKYRVCSPKDISNAFNYFRYMNAGVNAEWKGIPIYNNIIKLLKDSYHFSYDEENRRYYI